jgi:hypothetical protein
MPINYVSLFGSGGDFLPAAGGGDVGFDQQDSDFETTGTTLSVALTIPANANRQLVAVIALEQGTTISGITGGGTWVFLNSANAGARRWEIWYCLAASSGAVTVDATVAATLTSDGFMTVYSLYNAPDAATNFTSVTTDTDTIAVSNASGGVALFGVMTGSAATPFTDCSSTVDESGGFSQIEYCLHCTAAPTSTLAWGAVSTRVAVACSVPKAA